MANLFQRLLGLDDAKEDRAVLPPSRAAFPAPQTVVSADTALSLSSVYRAIQIIATPISKMEIKTYRFAGGEEDQIQNPLFVNKPSLIDTRRDFLFQTVSSLATTGEAFWAKTLNANGTVNSVRLIPSNLVTVRQDSFGNKVFDYSIPMPSPSLEPNDQPKMQVITATAKEMEHIKLFSKPGELRGLGPIQTCKDDIAAALDLRNYAANWFKNSGIPTGVLSTNMQLTSEQADEITNRWHTKQAERQVAVLGNGFAYDPIALSPKEALFTDVQSQMVQQIARMFGVPARLLLTGVDGSSDTYTNLQDENQVFYRHTLMAYLDAIEDAMSNCLPRGTRIKFDYEGLFKADIATRYNAYKVGVEGGWLSSDEVRTKEGL